MKRFVWCLLPMFLCAAAPTIHAAEKAAAAATKAPVGSLALLEKAVARDSTKFDNLYRLGIELIDHDRVADAIKVLAKAHQVRPKDMRTMVNLGAAYDANGRTAEAQSFYRKALVASPGDSVAICRLAGSLYAERKYPEAIGELRTLIEQKPNSYCAYFTLGVAFADAGIYRDAIRMWRKVMELAPSSPEAVSAKESIEVLEKYVQ